MAEYGLPALAGGRLRSTFSKPHGRRNPAYLLLGYRNPMPAQLPTADNVGVLLYWKQIVSFLKSEKFISRRWATKLIREILVFRVRLGSIIGCLA